MSRIRTRRRQRELVALAMAALVWLPIVAVLGLLAYATLFPASEAAGWLIALLKASPFVVK